jgi:tetratricopeptide (TPR) repeat protein
MPFEGPIEELSLFDLFQLLSLSHKTGTLFVRTENGEIRIYFKKGLIVSVKKGDYIKEKKQAQGMIFSILDVNKGTFSFTDSVIPDDLNDDYNLKVDNLILEASRRIDELAKIKQSIPSKDTVLMLSPKASKAESLDLTTEDWEIISYVDGARNIGDIIDIVGNEYDTKKHIYGLIKAGLLTTVEEVYEERIEESQEMPKDVLLNTANEFYLNGDFEASKSLLQKIVSLYPEEKDAFYSLALIMVRTGDFMKAKEITSKLLLEPGELTQENIVKLDNVLSSIIKILE